MATCRTHPDREAPHVCGGCAGPFCDACVVRFEKLVFCEPCKARFLAGVDEGPRSPRSAPARAKEASVRAQRARTTPPGRPLDWALGSAALVFSGIFGIVIIAALAKPVQALMDDRRLTKAFDQLIEVGSALERYRAETGKYPPTLDALVPTYLTEIPTDPYSGDRPRYSTVPSHRLWSFGPDEKDDGGEEPDDIVYAVDPIAGS
jgi:hypothetical protein